MRLTVERVRERVAACGGRGAGLRRRSAFTLVEIMCVVSITGVLTAMSRAPAQQLIVHTRVNRAAAAVAADLETALSLAGRTRRPVRISFDAERSVLTVADRSGAQTYLRRPMDSSTEFRLRTVTFSAPSIDVFPTGLTSGVLRVTLGADGYSRQLTVSRAGLLRVVPR